MPIDLKSIEVKNVVIIAAGEGVDELKSPMLEIVITNLRKLPVRSKMQRVVVVVAQKGGKDVFRGEFYGKLHSKPATADTPKIWIYFPKSMEEDDCFNCLPPPTINGVVRTVEKVTVEGPPDFDLEALELFAYTFATVLSSI